MIKEIFSHNDTKAAIKNRPAGSINSSYYPQSFQITPSILDLLQKSQDNLKPQVKKEGTLIHVDEIASKIAWFYERIIKIIDWKEENLLRRNAIERFLKRNFITELSKVNLIFKTDVVEIGEPLVRELIRGGHLPNDEIPQGKIPQVQKIIEKYLYLIKNAPFNNSGTPLIFKKRVNFYNWILEIAACEIEEVLSPPVKEGALIEAMTSLMNERISLIPPETLTDQEKILQTYIAVHRTLFDLDDAIIAYRLIKFRFPFWTESEKSFQDQIAQNIFSIEEGLEKDLHHPLAKEFFNLCEKTDTAFTLLSDIIDQFKSDPESLTKTFKDKVELKKQISLSYNKRLATLKSRLFKLAIFSTLSVFVSNWFTFFLVEVPIAHLFYDRFSLPAAIFDFLIPSVAMFLLVAAIKTPSQSNLEKVVELIFQFVYSNETKETHEIRLKKKKATVTNIFIVFLYVLACLAFLYGVARLFLAVKIPWTSVILDTIGIAINIFAALVIRNKAREITVEEKASLWEFLLDIISLPVAEIGSWLARKWKEYNVISVFFNVVIETPFVTFINFLESWRQFLKERKAAFH